MRRHLSDTIIAPATAPGIAAISVIRLSGPESISIVSRYFKPSGLESVSANTIHYGRIVDEEGKTLDEIVVSVFRAPRSYTREDIVEISCHGSPYIVEQILALFLRNGMRSANPGEFTMRAFLNGRFDLSQAEAVADLIASDSSASHDLAIKQMKGGFSKEIQELRQELIDFAALIELELDFSEEDVEFADRSRLVNLIHKIQTVIKGLIRSFALGNVIKNGVATVLAGKPNAGKSTLLNALLNEERAIVSEIAGTTRDTIEERLNINGVVFRLIDTAGIRDAQDKIEQTGVQRTYEKLRESALLIYVFDVIETNPAELESQLRELLNISNDEDKVSNPIKLIAVANKMDLNPYTNPEDYYVDGLTGKENLIPISAINQMNIEYLKETLYKTVIESDEISDRSIVTNTRHVEALRNADASLEATLQGVKSGMAGDLVAIDLRNALYHLGLITGEIGTEDLLDSIFSRFCIGK
jgi:tRNA modification GTPase